MDNKISLRKSELRRANNSRSKLGHTVSRYEYITRLKFKLSEKIIDIDAKVDTGSYYIVIGRDAIRFPDNIISKAIIQREQRELVSASGDVVIANPIMVNNFRLTDDIVFSRIKIYLSGNLGTKSLLGMDILTLFNFQYDRRDKTIWLGYEEDFLDKLEKSMLHKEKDYIDPGYIASIDISENQIVQQVDESYK